MAKGTYALALVALLGLPEISDAKTITYDRGGVVLEYARKVHAVIKSGEKVRIDGMCASACTLYLAKGVNLCITKRGYFKFHHPYNKNTKRLEKGTAEFMMYNYPGWVKSYINKRGGLSHNWITIPNSVARKYIKAC